MNETDMMREEVCALLRGSAVNCFAHDVLAPWIAHKSLEMGHLYSDLGLKSRTEMGKFMKKNFPDLAKRKPKEKLWKKFIYDEIQRVAPACASCNDQLTCFSCMVSELSA
ncbi:nitrogen fixation protein NifQ [bacterium]|nr:nitrogen fixation protein NifQ [bacterium]MBU1991367.1 nitrogen fixation protein NifQ [bacterium]